ncbi:MAG: Bug family tripartite tricarboxylate transporter substrate binding protein [Burkholderiales bacterium]
MTMLRHVGKRCAGLLLLAFAAGTLGAQDKPADYPRKPIRIVVGIAPGGGLDVMSRLGAQKISEKWNQSVIVDNRPGGGTVIGMDVVAHAQPDGYTLLGASETIMLNGVFRRAKYDVRKTFVPIVQLTTQPYTLSVHPSLPVRSVKEFVALAKSKPGAINFGSQGQGTVGHIGLERFKLMAGVDITHVPYKGAAPAVIDLLAGEIQATFATIATAGAHLKSGRLRAVAITGIRRSALLPDLSTVAEAGVPGFQLHNTYGYFAPAGTSMAIVRAINAVVSQGMNAPETVKTLAADGNEVVAPMTPEDLRIKLDREYAELDKLVKTLNITLK